MELRHLRYFLAVADELHFGRAAARLHIAQPPLSQQIKALERELGFPLFHRTRRRVRLTEAGLVLRDEARAVFQRLAQATDAAARAARGETGALAVGFVASAAFGLLPRLFRTFRGRYPGVALTLTELSTAEQVAGLRSGLIQLGIARAPIGDEGLVAEPLREEPLMVALPRGHRLAQESEVALPALADERFILFPRHPRPGWADVVLAACRAAGFSPSIVQETLELSTAVTLVAADTGVTLVPASAEALRVEGVTYRPLRRPAPTTLLLAITLPDEPRTPVVRFLEVAREVLAAP